MRLVDPTRRVVLDRRRGWVERFRGSLRYACRGLVLLVLAANAFADVQRTIYYEYDAAGNLVGIRVGDNLGAPDVTTLSPFYVHRDSVIDAVATGVNLFDVVVTTASAGLTLSNIQNVSATQVSFRVTTAPDAPIGAGVLTFTTGLGVDTEILLIAERVPIVATEPNLIVLTPDATPRIVYLVFDQPFGTPQTYEVAIRDPAVATLSQTTVMLPAGETRVGLDVAGQTVGATVLDITQPSNFLALAIPVLVEDAALAPGGLPVHHAPARRERLCARCGVDTRHVHWVTGGGERLHSIAPGRGRHVQQYAART